MIEVPKWNRVGADDGALPFSISYLPGKFPDLKYDSFNLLL